MGEPFAIDDVVLRYLRAFGPATVADVAAWSGLRGLREVLERLRPGLRTFRDPRGRELLDVPDAPILTGDEPADVRLLPDYDNALLSHEDRSRIAPSLEWPTLRDNVTMPAYLVDGFVAGIWKPYGSGARTAIELRPLVALAARSGRPSRPRPPRPSPSWSRRPTPAPSAGGATRPKASPRVTRPRESAGNESGVPTRGSDAQVEVRGPSRAARFANSFGDEWGTRTGTGEARRLSPRACSRPRDSRRRTAPAPRDRSPRP